MGNLKLIKNNISTEERINNRIQAFYDDLQKDYVDMEHISDILRVVHEYVILYSDEDVIMASIRIKEGIFYIDHFLSTDMCY
jgi:hypothetical protein